MRSREACRWDSTQACASSAVSRPDQMCSMSAEVVVEVVLVSAVVSIIVVLATSRHFVITDSRSLYIFADAPRKCSAYNTGDAFPDCFACHCRACRLGARPSHSHAGPQCGAAVRGNGEVGLRHGEPLAVCGVS